MHFSLYHLRMAELSLKDRGAIVILHKVRFTQTDIAKEVEAPKGSVSTTIRRFKRTGTAESAPRSGRPPSSLPELSDKSYTRLRLNPITLGPSMPTITT